jgi:hypothetical protein
MRRLQTGRNVPRSRPAKSVGDSSQVNVCQPSIPVLYHTNIIPVTPLNFSSSRCTLDELPSIDLPENYKTFGGFPGGALLAGDRELEEYDAYDLRVRQPIPLLLTARSGDSRQSKMVCIAPNNVVEGSRIPELKFPPSGATSIQGGFGTGVLIGVVGVVMLVNGFL